MRVLAAATAAAGLLAGSASRIGPPAVAATPADAHAQAVVKAANAFIATLTEDQKKEALYAFDDSAQRARWSNFPYSFFKRQGVRWGELNPAQRAAFMDLLGQELSPKGVTMITEQMAADDITRDTPPTAVGGRALPARQPGGPVAYFGADYFFISFLGTPSTTKPWMLQYGAHHLALNATMVGPNITVSPTMTGGEPLKYTAKDGKPVWIVEDEVTKAAAFLTSLTPEQRAKAVISPKLIQLVLGPGHDGQTLQPEGVSGAELNEMQKAKLLDVITARIGIMNAHDYERTMATIRKDLNQTWFAWYGPVDKPDESYFRVTAPTAIIEFSPQENDPRFPATNQHAHNMYRDPTNEYGAAWTSLK